MVYKTTKLEDMQVMDLKLESMKEGDEIAVCWIQKPLNKLKYKIHKIQEHEPNYIKVNEDLYYTKTGMCKIGTILFLMPLHLLPELIEHYEIKAIAKITGLEDTLSEVKYNHEYINS